MSDRDPYDLRSTYSRFRILVIGRANAGKTTLLQRVCNTTEDPCIYDENNKNLLEPTSARGIHDIHRAFAFKGNPGFIFHDSPGFETGDERQLQEVLSFIEERAKSTEVDDQLHAIWFCFVLNNARPLLPLERAFFETARAGRVPVIAIFTKFDDLMTQIYDIDQDDDVNRQNAEEQVEKKFRIPLYGYTFPPRADVCFEDLHIPDTGQHQDQVKVLIERTASSLDDTALRMLFVSVQQNNIDLCVQYAINSLTDKVGICTEDLTMRTMSWFGHSFLPVSANKRFANDLADILNVYFKANDSSPSSTSSYLEKESSLLMFTALLICMENTFWNNSRDGNFLELFKRSFTLYVESGMREKMEIDIDILRNKQGGCPVTDDFKAKFCKFIYEHLLPHPGDQLEVSELEQKKKKVDLAAKLDAKYP